MSARPLIFNQATLPGGADGATPPEGPGEPDLSDVSFPTAAESKIKAAAGRQLEGEDKI